MFRDVRRHQVFQLGVGVGDHFGAVVLGQPCQLRRLFWNDSDDMELSTGMLRLIDGGGERLFPGAVLSQIHRYQNLFESSHLFFSF